MALAARAAAAHPPAVLASSFGAEDMVLLDLIARDALPIGVFTLDTGRLPEETLRADRPRPRALSASTSTSSSPKAAARRALRARAGRQRVLRERRVARALLRDPQDASRSRARSPASGAWITGLRREQSVTRREVAVRGARRRARAAEVQSARRLDATTTSGPTSARTTCRTTRCTTAAIPASAARPARARSSPARTCAPAAGGGRSAETRECGLHRRPAPAPASRSCRAQAYHERLTCCDRPFEPTIDFARPTPTRRRTVADDLQPPRLARVGGDPHPARSRGPVRAIPPCSSPAARIRSCCCASPRRRSARARFRSRCCTSTPGTTFREVIDVSRRARGGARRAPDRALGRGLDRRAAASCCAIRDESRNPHQSVTLLDAIAEFELRRLHRRRAPRRGEGARQGAHVLVPRRRSASGTRRTSGRSCGTCTTRASTRASTCACSRSATGPSSTSGSTSQRERLDVPSIYFAHRRDDRAAQRPALVPVTDLTPPRDGRAVEDAVGALPHRRRHHLHRAGGVRRGRRSTAIIAETAATTITERGATRLDDQTNEASDGAAQEARAISDG